jgi:chorismate mutase
MDIEEFRLKIDELDRKIVELLSERGRAAQQIGRLKKSSTLPVYEPNREAVVFANVRSANKGPIPDDELVHLYERLIDVMRSLQQDVLLSGESEAKGSEEQQ